MSPAVPPVQSFAQQKSTIYPLSYQVNLKPVSVSLVMYDISRITFLVPSLSLVHNCRCVKIKKS